MSSEATQNVILGHGADPARIHLIPLGIDTDRFHPAPSAEAVRPLQVGFVGRLQERKGLDFVWRVMERLGPDAGIQFQFKGAIHPATRADTLSRLEQFASFARYHPPGGTEEMPAFMRSLDVLLLPSRFENFGLTYAEAMASGLVVFAGHGGGGPEMVTDGRTGFLVDPDGPVDTVVTRLEALAADRSAFGDMRQLAREIVRRFRSIRFAAGKADLCPDAASRPQTCPWGFARENPGDRCDRVFGPAIVARCAAGHDVIGASRAMVGRQPTRFALDITSRESCARAFEAAGRVDAVVHAAALAHVKPGLVSEAQCRLVNIEGTANAASAAAAAGVRRFVFISSVMVYGDFDLPLRARETDRCRPGGIYGEAKLAAEAICLARGEFESMHVLRMATMYSADWLHNVRKRVRPIARGRPLYFALDPLGRRYSLCSRRNGASRAWHVGAAAQGIYNITDDYETPARYQVRGQQADGQGAVRSRWRALVCGTGPSKCGAGAGGRTPTVAIGSSARPTSTRRSSGAWASARHRSAEYGRRRAVHNAARARLRLSRPDRSDNMQWLVVLQNSGEVMNREIC